MFLKPERLSISEVDSGAEEVAFDLQEDERHVDDKLGRRRDEEDYQRQECDLGGARSEVSRAIPSLRIRWGMRKDGEGDLQDLVHAYHE